MRTRLFPKFAVPVLSFATILFLFTVSAAAQGHGARGGIASRGVPASVTSFGFGGHPGFHGVPASVTSQGFGRGAAFRGVPGSVTSQGFGRGFRVHERLFRVDHRRGFYSPFYGGYYAPYVYPYYWSDEDDYYPQDDIAYDQQPTREEDDRQLLNDDYRAELYGQREQQPEAKAAEPVASQPDTVLIFKDGHQLEVANYAIVGGTLYDLTDGRTKKVQLAELDLPATVKENDERGVEFQLPAGTKLN